MALANELGFSGFHPEKIETTATATLENLPSGWTMTRIQLDVHAHVPAVSQADFTTAATAAKMNCPICAAVEHQHLDDGHSELIRGRPMGSEESRSGMQVDARRRAEEFAGACPRGFGAALPPVI